MYNNPNDEITHFGIEIVANFTHIVNNNSTIIPINPIQLDITFFSDHFIVDFSLDSCINKSNIMFHSFQAPHNFSDL
jgi:hypothetical protein